MNQYATTKGPRAIYKAVLPVNLTLGEGKSYFYLYLSQ